MPDYTNNYQMLKPTYAELADIQVINDNFEKTDDIMHKSQISLAPAYDSTKSYAEGDKVMYELLMYKCIAPTTGVWDATKWERTTASECGASTKLIGVASGNPASFPDGSDNPLEACNVDINPVQDLHGYDKPWAGGTGKNKLQNTVSSGESYGVTYTVNDDGTVSLRGTSSTSQDLLRIPINLPSGDYYFSGCPDGGSNSTYDMYAYDVTAGSRLKKWDGTTNSLSCFDSDDYEQIKVDDTHNNQLRIRVREGFDVTGIIFKPMICAGTATNPASFEPYANICPISGYTVIKVDVAGKNLAPRILGSSNGVTCSLNTDGSISATGRATATANIAVLFTVQETGTYTLSGCPSGGGASSYQIWIYDVTDVASTTLIDTGNNSTGQLEAGHIYSIRIRYASGVTANETFYPQLEKGTTATEFEPYKGNSTTIPLGQTVYGGTLNVKTGELTIDRYMVLLDGVNSTVSASATTNPNGRTVIYSAQVNTVDVYRTKSLCDKLSWSDKTYAELSLSEYTATVASGGVSMTVRFVLPISASATTAEANTYLQSNNYTFVFPLTTPQTVQLTPQEVRSILGQNYIEADSGDITVVYVRDLNSCISNIISRLEALEQANSNRSLSLNRSLSKSVKEPQEEPSEELKEEPNEEVKKEPEVKEEENNDSL